VKRTLGSSGIEVSAIGMGCWAIGGVWTFDGNAAGWSVVDDHESTLAIHEAIDLGVTFFDTAANYGCGHSEQILGSALAGRRDQVVIATKFGHRVDAESKNVTCYGVSEEASDVVPHMREDLETSLTNLGTDYIDLYQVHPGGLAIDRALPVRDELERFVAEGKIKAYGWSTDRTDAAAAFSDGPGCAAVQQQLSIFDGNFELLALCEEMGLASVNRSPLGMGILTGKFTADTEFNDDDVRGSAQWFPGLEDGRPAQRWIEALDSVRDVLTSDGRTLAQGAIAWLWGRSDITIPIPGFKTREQVRDNAGAMAFGPLAPEQMIDIDSILGR